MALMHITIIPLGTGSPSVGDYIADIENFLIQRGIPHSMGDMGTVLEGPVDDLLKVAAELHKLPFTRDIKRVVSHISIDDRHDLQRKIGEKRQAVYDRLERKRTHEKKE